MALSVVTDGLRGRAVSIEKDGSIPNNNQFYGTSLETPWGRKIYCEGLDNYWLFCRHEIPSPTDAVRSLTISNPGTGYPESDSPPRLLTGTGGGGTNFAGTYKATGGKIISVTITNQGSGYTSPPTVGFNPPGNNDAIVTAALGDGYEIEFSGGSTSGNMVAWGNVLSTSNMTETNGAKNNQQVYLGSQVRVYESSSEITQNVDNYDPGDVGVLRLTTDATRTITGFQKGHRGRYLTIINVGTNILNLAHQTGSAAANQIIVPGGGTLGVNAFSS